MIELIETQRFQVHREKGELAYWADMALLVEKARVAAQVRISHLEKRKVESPDTSEFLKKTIDLEEYLDGRMAAFIISHPVWPWASRVKGIGRENLPKVIGLIEAFGTWYDVGDPLIPPYIKRNPESYTVLKLDPDTKEMIPLEKVGIWVAGIERLTHISKLWKYAGLDVFEGHSPKAQAGSKLGFNRQLRSMLYRLGTSLMRAGGVWYDRYTTARSEIELRAALQGKKILQTPSGRLCPVCQVEVKLKTARICPECSSKLIAKSEPDGVLFKGHLHSMALREMIKDWTICLWIIWRQGLDLPVSQPYKVEKLGHKPIDPWQMVDR